MENIFAAANELTLDDYMRFETQDRSHMGENIPLIVYRLLEFSLKEELAECLGKDEQIRVFRASGFRAGSYFAKHFLDLSLEHDAFMAQLQTTLEQLHIGILRIEKVQEDGKIILTVAEDADCSGLPLLGETVCHYDEGFIGGIFSVYTGRPYEALEVDCWATGDRVCRFHVEPK